MDCKAKAKAAFDVFDKDKSGSIDAKELEGVLTDLNKKTGNKLSAEKIKEESKKFIEDVDKSKDGKVSFEEFCKFYECLFK